MFSFIHLVYILGVSVYFLFEAIGNVSLGGKSALITLRQKEVIKQNYYNFFLNCLQIMGLIFMLYKIYITNIEFFFKFYSDLFLYMLFYCLISVLFYFLWPLSEITARSIIKNNELYGKYNILSILPSFSFGAFKLKAINLMSRGMFAGVIISVCQNPDTIVTTTTDKEIAKADIQDGASTNQKIKLSDQEQQNNLQNSTVETQPFPSELINSPNEEYFDNPVELFLFCI
jgi:hypothetical protein